MSKGIKTQGRPPKRPFHKLSERRARFCQEFMVDRNATQAYIRAGYSETNADSASAHLMQDPAVKAEIKRLELHYRQKLSITVERVLDELQAIAFASPLDFYEWGEEGVHIKDSASLKKGKARAISTIKQKKTIRITKGGVRTVEVDLEIRLHDKLRAIEQIARHLGMFDDTVKLDAGGELLKVLQQVSGKTQGVLPRELRELAAPAPAK